MPYIKREDRAEIDDQIDELVKQLKTFDDGKVDGALNYTITRLLELTYDDINYFTINRVVGVINCVENEYYRRKAAPYEDRKKLLHGDVYRGL